MKKSYIILSTLVIIVSAIIYFILIMTSPRVTQNTDTNITSQTNDNPTNAISDLQTTASTSLFIEPIDSALKRITKKPFGIYVSPGNSPVSPEKFTGYHTGVDFEILPGEENVDIPIYAICDGTLLERRTATGYGGIAVESCKLNEQDITVIYGHLKLTSIAAKTGDKISVGEKLGILGKGYSLETDGERKHLHLGIHKGSAINLLGYVQNKMELNSWIDVLTYL